MAVRIGMLVGGLVLVVAATLPLLASLRYRAAVHDLHGELSAVEPASAELVEIEIDTCLDGVGPASVRQLRPIEGATVDDVRRDYLDEVATLGFTVNGHRAERARDDDLDADVVQLGVDREAATVTVTADAFDADMVSCLPF